MKNGSFTDAAMLQSPNGPVFYYRSGMAVWAEGLINGVPVSLGCNAAGYPLNVLSNCPTWLNIRNYWEPFSFLIEVNGVNICRSMTLADFKVESVEEKCTATAIYESSLMPVRVKQCTLLDGTQTLTRWLEIDNTGAEALNINRLVLRGGGLETQQWNDVGWGDVTDFRKIYGYGCFDNSEWGREGEYGEHDITPGAVSVDCRFGVDRFRHPALFLFNRVTGDTWSFQAGWSGGVRFSMNLRGGEERYATDLSFAAELTGYAPLYRLMSGETLVTPELHMGLVHGGLDEAVNDGIAHIRKSVLNLPEADGSALCIGAGMGAEHDMSVETTKSFARQMRDMGAEIFIIDAGWACPPHEEMRWGSYNGINRFNTERYPNGLAEVRDYIRSLGMKFALWMEPESLGSCSDVLKKHPNWLAHTVFGEKTDDFLDMTNPEVVAWVESEIARVVTEYKLDLLRIDYNKCIVNAFAFDNSGECVALRHYNAVYAMYRRLKKRFPEVIFENCAGGGGRTDLGQMKAFNHTWVSDMQKMPRSVEITNGMTMVLPPERVDRLFAGMGCHTRGELAAHMRNTMLTHMSLNVIAPAALQPNEDAMEFVRHSTKIYTAFIRPMLPTSLIFHHTPTRADALKAGCRALEIAAPDGACGALAVFTEKVAPADDLRIYLRGVDAGAQYEVYTDNSGARFTLSGAMLQQDGLRIRLTAALSSELVLYKKI